MRFFTNARMYAVTPQAEAAWRELIERVLALAGLDRDAEHGFDYLSYPAPQPLEPLWRRPDLGCAQMCGYPIALGLADVTPIAAPIPAADWAEGRAVYRSDLIVRADAPWQRLEETFDGRFGWTVAHSHSGFNAPRHHLLRHRTPERPRVYREVVGNLVTARRVLDAVVDGTIDVGPLDAYWHMLIRDTLPELTARVRVLTATDVAPMPAFVAGPNVPADIIARLGDGFARANGRDWFAPLGAALRITGFEAMSRASYAPTLRWDAEARAAGYPEPA